MTATRPNAEPVGPASAAVAHFLRTFERRDVNGAVECWSGPIDVIGVGGRRSDSLEAAVDRSASRYRRVAKHFERWHEWPADGGGHHVLSIGTLYGELLDGATFDGIRYVDFFELDAEMGIVRQEIWNDFGGARPTSP